MPKFAILRLCALLLLWSAAMPAFAREEVRSFLADVTLERDGSVRVTETIDVNAEGGEIHRGIYRDLPVAAAESDSLAGRRALSVESVTRDGVQEDYEVVRKDDYERIWIGNADRLVSRGMHRYRVTYRMTGIARTFADHDEFYWNATGNGWSIPILTAMANISLPDGTVAGRLAGYTGTKGATEQAVTITRHGQTLVSFQSQRPFAPGEGMTVAVSFQKGVIDEPVVSEPVSERWLPLGGLALVLFYMAGAWLIAGRPPAKGEIRPRFSAPAEISSAQAYIVRNGGHNDTGWTAMIAAIIDMAVQGLLRIGEGERGITITATDRVPQRPMARAEEELLGYFKAEKTVTIDAMGGGRMSWQRAKFMKRLVEESRGVWFRRNGTYVALASVLVFAVIGAMAWKGAISADGLIGSGILMAGLGMIGLMAPNLLRKAGVRRLVLMAIVLAVSGGVTAVIVLNQWTHLGTVIACALILLAYGFAMMMPVLTSRGQTALEQIEGFRLYLTGRSDHLLLKPADHFEALLPFAVALGLERPWSARFEAALVRDSANAADWALYDPIWYSSRPGAFQSGVEAIGFLSAGMATAMVASQPSGSESSNASFMESGSSGGGSGGGGGGGW